MDSLQTIEQRLKNIENSLAASKEVLTFDETASFTGFSKSYLYKLTSAGIIPYSKPLGKNMFFERAKVQEWLLKNPVKPYASITKKWYSKDKIRNLVLGIGVILEHLPQTINSIRTFFEWLATLLK